MSTLVITLTTAETKTIADAEAVLARVAADDFPWPSVSGEIKRHRDSLRDCLKDHAALTAENRHPADLFADLGYGQDNAMELALDWVTQDIRDWTAALCDLAGKAEEDRARVEAALAAMETGVAA